MTTHLINRTSDATECGTKVDAESSVATTSLASEVDCANCKKSDRYKNRKEPAATTSFVREASDPDPA